MPLVLVTHDRAIAALCQRRLTVDAGRIAADERGDAPVPAPAA